jgi:pectin methylesterase-like acyl-CoA thioesterase
MIGSRSIEATGPCRWRGVRSAANCVRAKKRNGLCPPALKAHVKRTLIWFCCAASALGTGCTAGPQPGAASLELGGAPAAAGADAADAAAAPAERAPGASTPEGSPSVAAPVGLGGGPGLSPAGSEGDAAPASGDAAVQIEDPAPTLDTSLPPGVVSRFPRPGAAGVCQDVPLRLTFGGDVTLGGAGRIRLFRSDRADVALDEIDMSATAFTDTIAARPVNRIRPVFLEGRDVSVYFRHDILEYDASYFVTIDAGVFELNGNPLAGIADQSWRFSTGARPSPASRIVVQREGEGDFCTLQGALDAVPANNTTPVTIELRNGTYHEMAYVTRKNNITVRGEDRDATRITYPNNDNLNPGTAARAMFTAISTDDLVIENLTLRNSTPQGGSQAEALRIRGNRAILRNANFLSLQDTLLLEGVVYVADAYVEGNVDFVWGQGTAYFERSEIKLVGRSGVIVQARNGANAAGYVFVDSRLTSDPGITGSALARIDATVYPNSQVVFIDCQLGPHISPAGWTITPAGTTATRALRFWEFRSRDLSGAALDVSRRDPASRQINAAEAAGMRDRAAVLGGWDPTL